MKKIIKKGTPPTKELECNVCGTIFETNEYKRLDLGGGKIILKDKCPECSKSISVTEE